jgi:6-phosphogluconolactonase (cycloisomerase 2 family)
MSFRPTLVFASLVLSTAVVAQPFGAVYTMTNAPNGNEVAVHLRLPGGGLVGFGRYETGGAGTGGALDSQGALAGSRSNRVVVVNPGSDELTLFRAFFFDLFLLRTSTVDSGGSMPTSVAIHGDLVYALNAASDSISGFRIRGHRLRPIAGATYPLSQAGAGAAQVGFSPDGRWIVVTERMTDTIGVFEVHDDGTLGNARFNPSAGPTPFGFLFRSDGVLVVSEAAGGAPNASSTSSYRIGMDGTLATVSGAVPTHQTAACWVAIPRGGEFAYTTNTGSGTVSGYRLDQGGTLALLEPNGVSGDLGAAARPIDFEFDPSGRFLFTLDVGGDRISTFVRRADGSLALLPGSVPVPDGSAGLLAR